MESVWVEPAVPGSREGVTLVSGFLAGPMCFPPKRCPLSMGSSSDWNGSEASHHQSLGWSYFLLWHLPAWTGVVGAFQGWLMGKADDDHPTGS